MASISIPASMQKACSSNHIIKKHYPIAKTITCSSATKQKSNIATMDVESKKVFRSTETLERPVHKSEPVVPEMDQVSDASMFNDEKWKNGTWDLNMFVKNGRMDWDGVIVAEATRRKFLEVHPETATNETPVTFRSSIIPWWAWLMRSYLPEAELLNGRAAMVGFFMSYFVDILTGLDVVGQTGNVVCKAGLLVTVVGVIVIRKTKDIGNLQKILDEATFYDKQWQASWQDQKK